MDLTMLDSELLAADPCTMACEDAVQLVAFSNLKSTPAAPLPKSRWRETAHGTCARAVPKANSAQSPRFS